jgi:pimeloyl-ACP methyl ester carboxylesterase
MGTTQAIAAGRPFRGSWQRLFVRLIMVVAALVLIGLAGFCGYAAAVGPDAILHPGYRADCRTPAELGWTYEAINYDIADDAALRSANTDMTDCSNQGTTAGKDVVAADGVPIAGWYMPAANGAPATATTVVLVHGWGDNKSGLLKYAAPLRAEFNVVAFDLRNGGRSGLRDTTFGLAEQQDLRAIIDWLTSVKHPDHIAVMGNSMGGGTALIEAATDARVEAVILDSTHARMSELLNRRMDVDEKLPPVPTTWAVMTSMRIRYGIDLDKADPVDYIAALGSRPLLIIHGTADLNDVPAQSAEVNAAEARASGVSVKVEMCQGGAHGKLVDTCPAEWGRWVTEFIAAALPAG